MPRHGAGDDQDDPRPRIIEDQAPANQGQGRDPNPPMTLSPGESIEGESVYQDSTDPQHITGVVSVGKKPELGSVRPKGNSDLKKIGNRDRCGQSNDQ